MSRFGNGSVRADTLAHELGLDVAELLGRADAEIGQVVKEQGLDAARGLTMRSGMNRGPVEISAALADRLRGSHE